MFFQTAAFVALAGGAVASRCKPHNATTTVEWETAYTATAAADVAAAAATAKTLSPTSHVKGKVFDRYVSIWFENTDIEKARSDRELILFYRLACRVSKYSDCVTQPTSSTMRARESSWIASMP